MGANILSFAEDDKLRPGEDVTSTTQHQIFDEKFDQEPESVYLSKWPTWQVVETKKGNKKSENTRKKEQRRKELESRMTIDMKIRTVPNVTSATRCYAIPLGENAKPFQNDITGFPKTYKL